jgi:hypothetical protein
MWVEASASALSDARWRSLSERKSVEWLFGVVFKWLFDFLTIIAEKCSF